MVVLATGWHALALKWPTSTGNQAVIVNELAAVGGMFCSYFLFKKKKKPERGRGEGPLPTGVSRFCWLRYTWMDCVDSCDIFRFETDFEMGIPDSPRLAAVPAVAAMPNLHVLAHHSLGDAISPSGVPPGHCPGLGMVWAKQSRRSLISLLFPLDSTTLALPFIHHPISPRSGSSLI